MNADRYSLLRRAFCDVPQVVGPYSLRPCSAASFELLGELENPLVFGGNAASERMDIQSVIRAVSEYIWVHSADEDAVCAIETRDQLPRAEIRKMALHIEIGEALAFTATFTAAAMKMAAALAEVEDDGEGSPGKPETALTGLPRSSSPSAVPEIPSASGTSSGALPSSAPSATSMPPMPPMEPSADGPPPLIILSPETTPPD